MVSPSILVNGGVKVCLWSTGAVLDDEAGVPAQLIRNW